MIGRVRFVIQSILDFIYPRQFLHIVKFLLISEEYKRICFVKWTTRIQSFKQNQALHVACCKRVSPNQANLFNRNVLKETQCSHYEEHLIDCLHALWLCDQVQLVWWLETSFLNLFQKKFRSFVDLVSTDCTVFKQAPRLTVALFFYDHLESLTKTQQDQRKKPTWALQKWHRKQRNSSLNSWMCSGN